MVDRVAGVFRARWGPWREREPPTVRVSDKLGTTEPLSCVLVAHPEQGRSFGVQELLTTFTEAVCSSVPEQRTTMDSIEAGQLATAELRAVLEELGVRVLGPSDERAADLVLPGPVFIDVKVASRPTISRLERLGLQQPTETVPVLVADQLDPGVRKALKDAGWGWLDRSGHLRLLAGSVQIDRPIPSLIGPDPSPPDPLGRPTGLAVAIELLGRIGPRVSVRQLAAAARVSVAATHLTLSELEQLGLLNQGQPRHPDLFWSVADRWRVRWFPLARGPLPGIPEPTRELLRMTFDDFSAPGWAEVGDRVAQAYGARVAADGPPRLYLPDRRALTWALRTWGEAADERSASSFLAVPPTTTATGHRSEIGSEWPAARPIVVALDLAADGSPRSREILDDWENMPSELERVW
jgi:AcrR family transcriptional regulator